MKTIVITSDKGGVGKSTLAALLIEWLHFNNISVDLIDADPIQTTRTWVDNCAADGRKILSKTSDYLIVDTAGTSGAGLTWLQKADIIVAPFQPHYPDIKTVLDWFNAINHKLQEKVMFLPNRYQKTNEQKEGVLQVQKVLDAENVGVLLPFLSNRPAIYGSLLNGHDTNFFIQHSDKIVETEAKNVMTALINKAMGGV
jgi:chromosome partitioning protein|tara:strand:- start:88 stop:684 length:597 start_codon:yes stop_codon:yes gene_type:complete